MQAPQRQVCCTGPRRFSADIDDGRPFVKQMLGKSNGFARIEMKATVRKGIRRHVHNAHDESASPKFKDARADLPLKNSPHG